VLEAFQHVVLPGGWRRAISAAHAGTGRDGRRKGAEETWQENGVDAPAKRRAK
jgi:hypothetical protein